jgi:hypothetical protein
VPENVERPDATPVRHGLDAFALTVGLLCLAVAGLTLVSRADLAKVDGVVVLATVWVVLGVVGVSRSLYRLLSRHEGRDAPQFGHESGA